MIAPCPISRILVFAVVTSKKFPFRSYGASFAQMSSTMLIDSRKMALRSFLKLPNTSASDMRPPGLMPKMKRPFSRWSSIATCAAIAAGWLLGMLTVPLPSTMFFVSCARLARNIRQEVTFSARSVMCSPTNASQKPSRSASRIASRSSGSVSDGLRPGGCSGIMNVPSFISRPSSVVYPLDVAAARRFEHSFERRDICDHLRLQHRIRRAACRRIRERLQIGEHRFCSGIVFDPLLLAPKFMGQCPPLWRLGVGLVAHLGPSLAAIDRKTPVEGSGEYGADQGIAAGLVSDEQSKRIAIHQVAAQLPHPRADVRSGSEQPDRKIEQVDSGGRHRPGGRFLFGQAPVVRRHRQEFVLAEIALDLQQGAELARGRHAE